MNDFIGFLCMQRVRLLGCNGKKTQNAKVTHETVSPTGATVAVPTGVGGWATIGLAEGLTKRIERLGADGLTASLADFANLGGTLIV